MAEKMPLSRDIDPKQMQIGIGRAENGWVVSGAPHYARESSPPLHVARTPKELVDLVLAWAEKQADMLPGYGDTK